MLQWQSGDLTQLWKSRSTVAMTDTIDAQKNSHIMFGRVALLIELAVWLYFFQPSYIVIWFYYIYICTAPCSYISLVAYSYTSRAPYSSVSEAPCGCMHWEFLLQLDWWFINGVELVISRALVLDFTSLYGCKIKTQWMKLLPWNRRWIDKAVNGTEVRTLNCIIELLTIWLQAYLM